MSERSFFPRLSGLLPVPPPYETAAMPSYLVLLMLAYVRWAALIVVFPVSLWSSYPSV